MKKDEKIIIAGAGAVLAYFIMEQKNKEKKINMSDVSISPMEFYA